MAYSRYLFFCASLFIMAACGGGGGGPSLPVNFDPAAQAGSAQTVDEGTNVQLQGSGVDIDGTIISYLWTQTSGPAVTLSNNTITNPTFTAPQVTAQTTLIFNLTVTDDDGATDTDGVIITVNDTNTAPMANAGPDQTVAINDPVQLAGSGSDTESAVTYSWLQISGTTVSLTDITIVNPSFTAPTVSANEDLVFQLTVTDTDGLTASDSVTITIDVGNTPPTVNAGPDQTVTEGDNVQLAGSGSDAEGGVTYLWTQDSGTTVTLSNTSIVNPIFTAPQVTSQQVLQFTLTVTDGDGASVTDSVNIIVNDTSTGTNTASYLFYSHGLNAVTPLPGDPTATTQVEPTANVVVDSFGINTSAEYLYLGDYNATTKIASDQHRHAVIYAHTDGHIYKVDGDVGGSLTPVQVSNEANADQICIRAIGGSSTFGDASNPDNSVYLYALPAPTTTCQDENYVWKAVRFGMGAADAPIAALEPVEELRDDTTGAITGWLVHDAGQLKRCDASFANCTNIVAVTDSVNSIIETTLHNSLLVIDGNFYIYNDTTDTLSNSVFSIPAGTFPTIPVSDGTTVYFGSETDLYSFPADGSVAATVFYDDSSNLLSRVAVTANKVVYMASTTADPNDVLPTQLKAIAKTPGSTPINLATTSGGNNHIVLLFTNTSYLYYNIQTYGGTPSAFEIIPLAAGIVDQNGGSKSETADAAWVGGALGTAFDFNQGSDFGLYAEQLVMAEGYNLAGTSGGYAGSTLTSYNALTATSGVTIGVIPDGEKVVGFNCFSIGPDSLCGSVNEISPTPPLPALPIQNDVYYINMTIANSLTRLTTTSDQVEILVQ